MAGAKSVLSDLINCCSWKPAQLLPQAGNITSKNSSFPEPLLLRLAAPPRSEAQLQRPQDNGRGYGLSPVKTGEADKELTRGVERLFGHCLISIAGICSVASTAGIKRQEEGNQWNYFLHPPRLTVPPLWQGRQLLLLLVDSGRCPRCVWQLCRGLRRQGLASGLVGY